MIDQGHWTGRVVNPEEHIGFVYIISDVNTGHAYIGRKQIWGAKSGVKGCKTRTPDRSSPKWKPVCWKESKWKDYLGSSKNWLKHMEENPDHIYEYKVLEVAPSKGLLNYLEARTQWEHRVMEAKLPDGSYKYYNGQIGAIKYRPKFN